MKFFYIKHKTYIYITAIVVSIILLAASVVNLIAVSPNSLILSQNIVVDLVASIVMIIATLFILTSVFLSVYKFNDEALSISLIAFIPVKAINYEDILLVRTSKDYSSLVLYVKTDGDKADYIEENTNIKSNIISININKKFTMQFVDLLKEKNNKILFEIFNEEA